MSIFKKFEHNDKTIGDVREKLGHMHKHAKHVGDDAQQEIQDALDRLNHVVSHHHNSLSDKIKDQMKS